MNITRIELGLLAVAEHCGNIRLEYCIFLCSGHRLEPLYAPIRHKLANALTKWHPSDISAKLMLKPWLKVFSPGHTEAFLAKNIVPKLAICLQEMVINPANQNMGQSVLLILLHVFDVLSIVAWLLLKYCHEIIFFYNEIRRDGSMFVMPVDFCCCYR